jgi:hypothetical protein
VVIFVYASFISRHLSHLVAFYVYNQQKVRVERPESDAGSTLARYKDEPVAWAPELPSDWQPQDVHRTTHTSPRNASGGAASSRQTVPTLPSMSRIDGRRRLGMSPDPDYADLEDQVMDGGTEIDYGIGVGGHGGHDHHDFRSDEQERSIAMPSPMLAKVIIICQHFANVTYFGLE